MTCLRIIVDYTGRLLPKGVPFFKPTVYKRIRKNRHFSIRKGHKMGAWALLELTDADYFHYS